jgi:Domain of unknown function (DUF4082)
MGHGYLGDTIWGDLIPPAGPAEPGPFTVGWWFTTSAAIKVHGFRAYSKGVNPYFAFYQVWNVAGDLIAEACITGRANTAPVTTAGWRGVWLSPQWRPAIDTPYLLTFSSGNDIWRNDGFLTTSAFVSGPITVLKSSDAPFGHNGVYNATTIGSCFDFINMPVDDAVGNFYGIDMFYNPI